MFAVCLLLLLGARSHAVILLNDTFADGERFTQGLPDSAHWYVGGASSTASVSADGRLAFLDASGGKATAMAYFNPTQLLVGQSITLSFNYSFSQVANGDNNFLFGLYNSGGVRLAGDNLGFNNALFKNYTGYATSGVFGPDPSGPGRDHIEARDKVGNNLLSIALYNEGAESRQTGGATLGQIDVASMQISRTGAGITVVSRVGNNQFSQQYNTSEMFTSFDTVGIFSNGNTGTFTMDNVRVDYLGIPEPSTFGAIALFGLAAFGKTVCGTIKAAWLKMLSFVALCF